MGIVSGNLRCPFHNDLKGNNWVKISLDCNPGEEPIKINVSEEHFNFELRGKPNTVVTVNINSNFSRSTEADPRELSVVLEDTDGN